MTLIELASAIEDTKTKIAEAETALHSVQEDAELLQEKHKAEMAGVNLIVSEKESDLKSKNDQLHHLYDQMRTSITATPVAVKVVEKAPRSTARPTDAELKQIALDGMKYRSR